MAAMPLDYIVRAGTVSARDARTLRLRIGRVMRALERSRENVSIVLTNDEEIHALNRTYRKKNKPTDVLAFALSEGDFAEHRGRMLGDVIVSVETAAKQAARANKTLLDEVSMLLVHGILHLLGWDHDTPAKERRMTKETNRLLAIAKKPSISPKKR
jgi:probable rRNA maturation factor